LFEVSSKMKIVCCMFINVFFLIAVFGQSAVQLQAELDKGVSEDALRAILAAGKSGDKNFIPLLKKLAKQPRSREELNSVSSCAQIALAKLGQEEYLKAIIADVDSGNIFFQDVAIQKLAKVGGRSAFRVFFELLDDNKYRAEVPTAEEIQRAKQMGAVIRKGDEILEPRSFLVMRLLANIVDDPPVIRDIAPNENSILLWKNWFENHKYLIE